MKNLKNTAAAMALVAVMGLGTATVNAGIMVSDKAGSAGTTTQCNARQESWGSKIKGIILIGINGIMVSDGLMLSDGIMVSDSKCKDGIMVSDAPNRDGIMVSD